MAQLIYSLLVFCVGAVLASQHSPYSLQAAVDALHRREAQLALRDEATGEPLDDEGYWLEPNDDQPPYRPNRQRLNKILANYLRRDDDLEDGPFDPYELEARKRSVFRERDALAELPPYPTVFRERELEKAYQHPDLSSDFLKEVDRQANLEQEEKYLDRLRQLWEKYQQQENEIEQELFDEERANGGEESPYFDKRQGYPTMSQAEAAMYYGPPMEEKKRSMPMLPWLPASRKKRFPVAKRSPKPEASASGTDEKVAKDLQALFGESDDKKKRSSELDIEKKQDKPNETKTHEKRDASDEHEHEHSSEEGHDDEEHDHEHDHDHEHEHEESSEEFEGEDDDKKKKRSLKKRSSLDDDDDDDDKKKRAVRKRANLEVVKEDQIIPGDIGEFKAKKSIQWNKYFGMDRKKKDGRDSGVYPLSFYKAYDEDRKKKSLNQDKLENMDRKLKTIEDLILDQTVKYTGDHEGILTEPEDLQKLKDKVVARLATAYNIEKMRRTLERLKESVDDDSNPLTENEIDTDKRDDKKEKAKRVAIKKEKAEYDHSQHSLQPSEKVNQDEVENDLDELDDDKKKKKKKRMSKRYQEVYRNEVPDFDDEYGAGHYVPGGETYGRSVSVENNECPLLDALERRCRGVDVLSGDIYQDLLPTCGAHQLCYLCGTSQTVCDFQYLAESDTICEGQSNCQSTARSALMILRGFPGPQLGPRECAKNPCLYRAMLEVGVSGL